MNLPCELYHHIFYILSPNSALSLSGTNTHLNIIYTGWIQTQLKQISLKIDNIPLFTSINIYKICWKIYNSSNNIDKMELLDFLSSKEQLILYPSWPKATVLSLVKLLRIPYSKYNSFIYPRTYTEEQEVSMFKENSKMRFLLPTWRFRSLTGSGYINIIKKFILVLYSYGRSVEPVTELITSDNYALICDKLFEIICKRDIVKCIKSLTYVESLVFTDRLKVYLKICIAYKAYNLLIFLAENEQIDLSQYINVWKIFKFIIRKKKTKLLSILYHRYKKRLSLVHKAKVKKHMKGKNIYS